MGDVGDMSKPTISAVIMARNESANIVDAISTLSFADQIIVADTGSKDNTLELAGNAGAETHSILFDGYGASKNRAISYANCDWIFSMDADERVSPELACAIRKAIESGNDYNGYEINRLTYFLGTPIRHSGWFPEYIPRLIRRGKGKFNRKLVHEGIEIDGKMSRLDGLLYHYSYRDLESYFDKLNVYSEMSAREMFDQKRNCNLVKLLFYPPAAFVKMYIQKAGFLDGYHGFLLAVLSSFHVFVKYAKLRELYRREP
jgi:glycosyltransferase involved in cell wall biosynthesis